MSSRQFFIQEIFPRETAALALDKELVLIGSSEENDIVLDDENVEDCAAKITGSDNSPSIEAVGKSKVIVNGRKIKRVSLSHGDRIEIQSHVLLVEKSRAGSEPSNGSDFGLLDKLNRLVNSIGKERDPRLLLRNLLSTLVEIIGGAEVFIFKLDQEKKPQVFVSTCQGSSNERFSDTIVQEVVKRGEGIFIPNALTHPTFNKAQSITDLHLQSVICTPIMISGTVHGLIYVGSRNAVVSYTQKDLEYVNLYAMIAAVLINHTDYISRQTNNLLKLTGKLSEDGIIAESKVMQDLLVSVSSIAASEITVLLEGETGTGKSKIAGIIHNKSNRSAKPFVVINCSALRGELLESELFGHKKGSFTGAVEDHEGLFASADGGTIFLDEIGELEMPLQAKLLRTLETGKIRPIGSTTERTVDVRIVCATNRNLVGMVAENRFRADLYYRINQFNLEIPPLRKRGEDLILLAYFFLEQYKALYPAKDIFDIHPEALRFIQTYSWPGNIRELSNCIHRSVITGSNPLLKLCLNQQTNQTTADFETATRAFQKELIQKAIDGAGGNKEEAAGRLGLSRSTFYRYYSQLGL